MMQFFVYLYNSGFLNSLFNYYLVIISCVILFKSFQYFVNNIYDDLLIYLKDEWDKDWYYEQSTDMQTGMTNIENVISSLGGWTKKVKRQIQINKKNRAELKQRLKKQAETIRQNKIKHIRWLEEYYNNPPTEEESKEELKQLLKDMRKKYKKWLD